MSEEIAQSSFPTVSVKGHGRKAKTDIACNTFSEGLIIIKNDDSLCLFHALETARMHLTEKDRKKFFRYRQNMAHQHKHIIELLQETNIPRHNKIYSAQTFVPIIQLSNDITMKFIRTSYALPCFRGLEHISP
jgi:hypothetical protein